MATRRYRRWPWLAALALALAAIIAATGIDQGVGDGADEYDSRPARRGVTIIGHTGETVRPRTVRQHAPHRPAAEDIPAGDPPDRAVRVRMRAATPVARRFLAALLAFELSGGTPEVRAALRASATPALARFLIARPPRRPAGAAPPRRGRLVGLEPLTAASSGRLELAATIARPGRRTGLIVTLRRGGDGWRVSALR